MADENAPTQAATSSAASSAVAPAATADTPPGQLLTVDVVKSALRRVKDPELSLNIIDLGLVYDIHVDAGTVAIDMSLTSPGCPSGPEIMQNAEEEVKKIPGVDHVAMNLVWSPMWSPDRIEPRIRAYLGF